MFQDVIFLDLFFLVIQKRIAIHVIERPRQTIADLGARDPKTTTADACGGVPSASTAGLDD